MAGIKMTAVNFIMDSTRSIVIRSAGPGILSPPVLTLAVGPAAQKLLRPFKAIVNGRLHR